MIFVVKTRRQDRKETQDLSFQTSARKVSADVTLRSGKIEFHSSDTENSPADIDNSTPDRIALDIVSISSLVMAG